MKQRVLIPSDSVAQEGDLTIPKDAIGIVLFAHGSGSSRLSPRNQFVADALQEVGVGTLLFDLLTEAEAEDRDNVFDIDFLAHRLVDATRWLRHRDGTRNYPLGYFGASTGAAAALRCAADRPELVHGVVSRGGRPDLAAEALNAVGAPTLLIVGGNDPLVRDLNEQAAATISSGVEVVVIPGATHLFEEPGALDAVIDATIERLRRWQAA